MSAFKYILILAQCPSQESLIEPLLKRLGHSTAIAYSEEQAIVQASRNPPFLIILIGNHTDWSPLLLRTLRNRADRYHITLVALTDYPALSWIPQDDNPGFDGFLVNPISSEVLISLVQSAHTRQSCCAVS